MTTVHAATATQKTVDGPSNKVRFHHRVGRVLSFCPVVGIRTPPPLHPQGVFAPHPFGSGGEGQTRLHVRGDSPNSDEGTYQGHTLW
jgi:hypothetical protein